MSGKAILNGAKAAKQGTTFFKGTQQVLKATGKNIVTNVKGTFKAVKELPGKVKDTGSNVVKKFSSLFVKNSTTTSKAVDTATATLNKILQNSKSTNPYELLRQRGIPTTFSDEEVALSNALGLRMQAKSSKQVSTDFIVSPNGVIEGVSNGQHVLERHVNLTDSELVARVQNTSYISGASTFTDDVIADSVINTVIKDAKNIQKIDKWLSSGRKGNLPLQYLYHYNIKVVILLVEVYNKEVLQ